MSPPIHTGGCACGAVRYEAAGDPFDRTSCHCALCRRTTGAPFVAWASVRAADFRFTQGEPRSFASSGHARRAFCGACGTQLTFRSDESPDAVDFTLGSLDRPELVVPTDHIWVQSRLPWVKMGDGLPEHPRRRG